MLNALQDGLIQPLLPALHCVSTLLPTTVTATTAPATTATAPMSAGGVVGTPTPGGGVVFPAGLQAHAAVAGVGTAAVGRAAVGTAAAHATLLFGDFSSSSSSGSSHGGESDEEVQEEEEAQQGPSNEQQGPSNEQQGPSNEQQGGKTHPAPLADGQRKRLVPFVDFAPAPDAAAETGDGVHASVDLVLTDHAALVNDALTWDVEEEREEEGVAGGEEEKVGIAGYTEGEKNKMVGDVGEGKGDDDDNDEQDALLEALIAEDAMLGGDVDGDVGSIGGVDGDEHTAAGHGEEEDVQALVQSCFDAAVHAGMFACTFDYWCVCV